MKITTFRPQDIAEEGCFFSIDLEDSCGDSIELYSVPAESDEGLLLNEGNVLECRRLAYLNAIYEAEALVGALRQAAADLGIEASHYEILTARITVGEKLTNQERAWRQGYIFNHDGRIGGYQVI